MRLAFLVLMWVCLVLAALAAPSVHAAEGDVTARQVDNWAIAYSVKRSSESYLYVDLIRDVRRVLACESRGDLDVINGRRFGKAGEVGPGQFLPGPGSIFWKSEAAAAGFDYYDAEANVAATVELISKGYGPRNWSCW